MKITFRSLLPVAVLVLLGLPLRADIHTSGAPRSTNNDDSCDVSYLPAATLLLPYFEVDPDDIGGETTIFTVTNVGAFPQIARVTLWTDYAIPVLSFNIYLTGYDVQGINLRDVIVRGVVAPDDGTGTAVSPRGSLSKPSNTKIDVRDCIQLPGQLPTEVVERVLGALTLGVFPAVGSDPACNRTGLVHENAIGYATIDVVAACTDAMPGDAAYFAQDIRYDNVLIGDYQQINPTENFAQGGTLVHIRAVPEGGTQATRADDANLHTNLPRTFYGRFTKNGISDARQPLPTQFGGRWISGGPTAFQTTFKIWRELAEHTGTCRVPDLDFVDIVTFDEAENAVGTASPPIGTPIPPFIAAASRLSVENAFVFPQPANGAIAGWVYMNLDRKAGDAFVDQAWLISSMRAEGRYSADNDALAFGNGCSAAVTATKQTTGDGTIIGPSPNTTP
jgi:hypothetical protein